MIQVAKDYKEEINFRMDLFFCNEVDNLDLLISFDEYYKEMIKKGFKQVGKGFPVFLHPNTNEEYALARKDRKTGVGHKNFKFNFSPKVTLEEDLERRDLTINSMAIDENDNLIDPFNGAGDIKNKC